MEYGCYDCGMGMPFLDALVGFLLVVPVAIALVLICHRLIKWMRQNSNKTST